MVDPADVGNILSDAARLVGEGRIVVFGSAALAFWLTDAPRSRDVDVWVEPEERGHAVQSLMGELSWYDDKHGAYVEVWGPETFAAPRSWPDRARRLTNEDHPGVELWVPHPHDVLVSKLERHETQDLDHAKRILAQFPLSASRLDTLAGQTPHRDGSIVDPDRIARFEAGLAAVRRLL